jgi:hypothetical protein
MPAILVVAFEWLVAALGWLVRSQIGQWILAALAFFGIKFFVADNAIEALMSFVQERMAGVPSFMADWLGYVNVDRYISIVLSAYATVLAKRLIPRKV